MMKNPFNITKAVDYTDEEIIKYWVDLSSEGGFKQILKPNSPMPMFILGSKGSGKTHLMRYFSYQLQKLRWNNDFKGGLNGDKYFGIFFRCSGLNSERFKGKGKSEDIWKAVFEYYMEIWIGQLIIGIIQDFLSESKLLNEINETEICTEILNLFDKNPSLNVCNFNEILNHLQKLQKEIDYSVNNWAFRSNSDSLDFPILITTGKLIFGIPQILSKKIDWFKDILFIYLVDEFENISESQQKYFNTLYREREAPVTFKIGARLYGVKSFETYGGHEENKEGSEFEKIVIDEFLRENKGYDAFIREICSKRLQEVGYNIDKVNIDSFFEEVDYSVIFKKIRLKGEKYSKGHLNKLYGKLKGLDKAKRENIISNISFEKDLLLERTNIFLLYRDWSTNKINLEEASSKIKDECEEYYISKSSNSRHHKILDKFKSDIIDQLFRETGEKIIYAGFKSFITMSSGIPRNLLTILKHAYKWAYFNDKIKPFYEGKISIEAQRKAVINTAEWFLEDNRIPAEDGRHILKSIQRIGKLLQAIRYSDLPPECSISSFSFNREELELEILKIIDFLEKWSYIIEIDKRRDKNTNKQLNSFRMNGIIAPIWELAIATRGIIEIAPKELKKIIEFKSEDELDIFIEKRTAKYNAPFTVASQELF